MEFTVNYSRLFTVNEANELLPMLRPLVEQILDNIRRLKSASETVIRREQLDAEAPDLMEQLRARQRDHQVSSARCKSWVDEINAHGCRVQRRGAGVDRLSVHARRRSGFSLLAARRTERQFLASHRRWFRRTQAIARRRRLRPGERNVLSLIRSAKIRRFAAQVRLVHISSYSAHEACHGGQRQVLSARIKEAAQQLGFALVGISPVKAPPHEESFARWLRQGLAGELEYMERTEALRRDPRRAGALGGFDHFRGYELLHRLSAAADRRRRPTAGFRAMRGATIIMTLMQSQVGVAAGTIRTG